MKRFFLLLPLAALLTAPHAQTGKSRVAMVNVQTLVKAMPGNAAYIKVYNQSETDLKAKQASLQTLAAKAAASKSAADQQALTKARQAYATSQQTYQKQIAEAFKPLATKLNAAVAQAAKANGFSVVFDERVAAQTSLVIYASEATNLTAAVQKLLK